MFIGRNIEDMKTTDKFIRKLLILAAEKDIIFELIWDENLNFSILCNDLFWWGTADCESVTKETLPILKKAIKDAGNNYGPYLYCARQRKMRPQGAWYSERNKKVWHLFNACGPEREISMCNPKNQKGEYLYKGEFFTDET
jgi:hypothetical protein